MGQVRDLEDVASPRFVEVYLDRGLNLRVRRDHQISEPGSHRILHLKACDSMLDDLGQVMQGSAG